MYIKFRFTGVFIGLMMSCSSIFAGVAPTEMSPAEQAMDDQGYTIVDNRASHFYVNTGVDYIHINLPDYTFPWTDGGGRSEDGPFLRTTSTSELNLDNEMDTVRPSLALGYTFYNNDEMLRDIFGEASSVEFRYSYAHDSASDIDDLNGLYGNGWFIAGVNSAGDSAINEGDSTSLIGNDYSYDDTIQTFGVYFIGDKPMGTSMKQSPYVGLDFITLDQDIDYDISMYLIPENEASETSSAGSDDLSSYYFGVSAGDTLTRYLGQHFDVYTELGLSIYMVHSDLDSTQVPYTVGDSPTNTATYTVDQTDDTWTFRAKWALGSSYYFKGNQDPSSPRLVLSGGFEYWNDVPYADNPTATGEEVEVSYDQSTSYYAGLNLIYPFK